MENEKRTVRLIYPQWQGGDIVRWVPEIRNPDDAARGYFLGAQLLAFLAPHSSVQTLTVPVADGIAERRVTDGVLDRDAIVAQTRAAVSMLRAGDPDRIVTFGGDCSVSAAPFAFLAGKYGDDAAVIWIDAHPDITLPGDAYSGYHAMALAACMGLGDAKILAELPARIDPSRVLLVGLRDWERDEIRARQRELGIAHLAPQDVAGDSRAVVEWLESCGASKVLIHFDLDVLDPADLVAAVGVVRDDRRSGRPVDRRHRPGAGGGRSDGSRADAPDSRSDQGYVETLALVGVTGSSRVQVRRNGAGRAPQPASGAREVSRVTGKSGARRAVRYFSSAGPVSWCLSTRASR